MKTEMRALFKGNLQGVCFRASVQAYAEDLGLVGYAQNLSDGSVLIKAVGEKTQLEMLLEKIQKKPGFGKIEEMDISYAESSESYQGFSVR